MAHILHAWYLATPSGCSAEVGWIHSFLNYSLATSTDAQRLLKSPQRCRSMVCPRSEAERGFFCWSGALATETYRTPMVAQTDEDLSWLSNLCSFNNLRKEVGGIWIASFAISRVLRTMEGPEDPTKGPTIRDDFEGQGGGSRSREDWKPWGL